MLSGCFPLWVGRPGQQRVRVNLKPELWLGLLASSWMRTHLVDWLVESSIRRWVISPDQQPKMVESTLIWVPLLIHRTGTFSVDLPDFCNLQRHKEAISLSLVKLRRPSGLLKNLHQSFLQQAQSLISQVSLIFQVGGGRKYSWLSYFICPPVNCIFCQLFSSF